MNIPLNFVTSHLVLEAIHLQTSIIESSKTFSCRSLLQFNQVLERMGFMGGRRSRVLWCSTLFGLFGWAMIEVSELTAVDPLPRRYSRGSRRLVSGFICAFFGLSLAAFSELWERSKGSDDPLPLEDTPAAVEVDCGICLDCKPLLDMFDMVFCPHSFCKSCIGRYVATKVEENLVTNTIKCPDPDCIDGKLDPDLCQLVVAPEVLDRWERVVCEKTILAKFYCPFKDCSAVLADERGERRTEITQAECPHCRRLFCAACEVPWHAEVKCEEFQKLGKDERGREDIMVMTLAKTEKWQRCPKCKFYVEKSQGCMFIKCRCGFVFCYRCGTETIKDHYCAKCKG